MVLRKLQGWIGALEIRAQGAYMTLSTVCESGCGPDMIGACNSTNETW